MILIKNAEGDGFYRLLPACNKLIILLPLLNEYTAEGFTASQSYIISTIWHRHLVIVYASSTLLFYCIYHIQRCKSNNRDIKQRFHYDSNENARRSDGENGM